MSEREITWWVLFEVVGLRVAGDSHDLDKPLFGDATLLSTPAFGKLSSIFLEGLSGPARMLESEWLATIATSSSLPNSAFDSYLAVRRTARSRFEGEEQGEEHHKPPASILRAAESRAEEIVALLNIICLVASGLEKACELGVGRISYSTRRMAFNFIDKNLLSVSTDSYQRPFRVNPLKPMHLRRRRLKQLFKQKRFDVVFRAIVWHDATIPKSFRRVIRQVTTRLSKGVHAATLSSNLLGAVIALEILFAYERNEYSKIQKRIRALLGTNESLRLRVNEVFEARHLYVHRGQDVKESDLAFDAIALGITCLVRYAQSIVSFRDKQEFLQYLDAIYMLEISSSDLRGVIDIPYQNFLKHLQRGIGLGTVRERK